MDENIVIKFFYFYVCITCLVEINCTGNGTFYLKIDDVFAFFYLFYTLIRKETVQRLNYKFALSRVAIVDAVCDLLVIIYFTGLLVHKTQYQTSKILEFLIVFMRYKFAFFSHIFICNIK